MIRRMLWLVMAAGIGGGCKSVETLLDPSYVGPFRSQYNYVSRPVPGGAVIRRVAVLPVVGREDGGRGDLGAGSDMVQPMLLEELRLSRAFEVVGFNPSHESRLSGPSGYRVTDVLPPTLLNEVLEATGADAVLFTQVTGFHAYPPLVLGLKFSLVFCREPLVVWEFDDVFNAGDPPTLNAVRRYLREHQSEEDETVEGITLSSPRRLSRFALSTALGTLPRSGHKPVDEKKEVKSPH